MVICFFFFFSCTNRCYNNKKFRLHNLHRINPANLLPSEISFSSFFLKINVQENSCKMVTGNRIKWGVRIICTHSSITRPSPIIRGPESSGGFLRASSAASDSASCLFNLSICFNKILPMYTVNAVISIWAMRQMYYLYLAFDLQCRGVPDPGKQPAIFAPLQLDLSAHRTCFEKSKRWIQG